MMIKKPALDVDEPVDVDPGVPGAEGLDGFEGFEGVEGVEGLLFPGVVLGTLAESDITDTVLTSELVTKISPITGSYARSRGYVPTAIFSNTVLLLSEITWTVS